VYHGAITNAQMILCSWKLLFNLLEADLGGTPSDGAL